MSTDRFRLIAEAGAGGMGKVWRAWDNRIDREVAVKIITLSGVSEAERAEAYHRTVAEARAAAKVRRHPGIAAVYDVFEAADGCPWIVMEFVPGRSLDRVIAESGPLPPAVAADVGLQVLDALDAGHAAGVLHRDLKPANIMITPEGNVVLTDFGIARIAGTPATTQPGGFCGTAGFTAPERILGHSTPAADLWSLGATLFAAAAGHDPYARYPNSWMVNNAILTEEPPTLPASAPLADLIGALMSRDPARRPDAAQARQALLAFTASLGPGTPADAGAWWTTAVPPPATDDGAGAVPSGPPTVRLDKTSTIAFEPPPNGGTPQGWPEPTPQPLTGRPRRHRRLALAVAAAFVAWAGLGGGLWAALASGGPAAVPPLDTFRAVATVNSNQHPEVFAITPGGVLVHDYYWNGTWMQWAPVVTGAGSFTGTPAVIQDSTGRLEVFARSRSGQLMRFWQNTPSDGPWDGPAAIDGAKVASDPSVIMLPGTDLLEVFADLPDGSLATATQLAPGPTGAWSGWHSLGGKLGGPPVAAVNADGHPEVFALAPDRSLLHAYRQSGSGTWSGWSVLQAGGFTGVPAVARNAAGELEVFLRTSAGAIDRTQEERPSLGPWSPLTAVSPAGMASGPGVYQRPDGAIEVFAEAADGTVGHAWELRSGQSNAGWAPWTPLSGDGGGTAGTPVAVSEYGTTTLLIRMAQGGIAVSRATTAGNWSRWTTLSGARF